MPVTIAIGPHIGDGNLDQVQADVFDHVRLYFCVQAQNTIESVSQQADDEWIRKRAGSTKIVYARHPVSYDVIRYLRHSILELSEMLTS